MNILSLLPDWLVLSAAMVALGAVILIAWRLGWLVRNHLAGSVLCGALAFVLGWAARILTRRARRT